MSVVAYEAKFHFLSCYVTHLLTTEEAMVKLFIKGLNYEFWIFSVHMTSARKMFNEILNYVNKLEGVTPVGQAKMSIMKLVMLGAQWILLQGP